MLHRSIFKPMATKAASGRSTPKFTSTRALASSRHRCNDERVRVELHSMSSNERAQSSEAATEASDRKAESHRRRPEGRRGTVLCTDLRRGRDYAKRDEAQQGWQGRLTLAPPIN